MGQTITELETANHLLTDFGRLDATYQEQGYLFFRNVLDSEAVGRVKEDFVRVLQEQADSCDCGRI